MQQLNSIAFIKKTQLDRGCLLLAASQFSLSRPQKIGHNEILLHLRPLVTLASQKVSSCTATQYIWSTPKRNPSLVKYLKALDHGLFLMAITLMISLVTINMKNYELDRNRVHILINVSTKSMYNPCRNVPWLQLAIFS